MNRKGPWEGYICLLPAFLCAHIFISRERHLGTRQGVSHMEPDLSLPQRPLCVFAIFLGIPSGSLCGGERSRTPSHELLIVMSNGNRTEWGPIWSVIIRVINKIGRPRSGSPICLITSMITDRIGRHEVLLPINHNFNKICDI